jgi:hypothetical protein
VKKEGSQVEIKHIGKSGLMGPFKESKSNRYERNICERGKYNAKYRFSLQNSCLFYTTRIVALSNSIDKILLFVMLSQELIPSF